MVPVRDGRRRQLCLALAVLGGISIGLYFSGLGEGGKYLLAAVLQIATLRRGNKSHPFVLALLKIFCKVPTFPVQLNGFHCRKLLGQRGTVEENILYNDSKPHIKIPFAACLFFHRTTNTL